MPARWFEIRSWSRKHWLIGVAAVFALMVGVIAVWPQCSGLDEGQPTSPDGPPSAKRFCDYTSLIRNMGRRLVGLHYR
jgi:hypothetical protein